MVSKSTLELMFVMACLVQVLMCFFYLLESRNVTKNVSITSFSIEILKFAVGLVWL